MSGIVNTADVYTEAIRLAQSSNQVVGEKSDYYITLEQLETILQKKQYRPDFHGASA